MKRILIIVGIIIFIILFAAVLLFSIVLFSIKPHKPKITCGEFPFVLTYELNGKRNIISDTIICEFDGYTEPTTAGQYRKWKVSIKNAGMNSKSEDHVHIPILNLEDENIVDDFGNKVLELYFFGGNGYYYMCDDLGNCAIGPQQLYEVDYKYQSQDGNIGHSAISSEEAYERYRIRLISWEIEPPIKNFFV